MPEQLPKLIATAFRPDQLVAVSDASAIFLGRSNAGKSSLINALLKKRLAMTAKAPGKTRSINYYRYLPHLVLIDLPGFGYARVSHGERDAWRDLTFAFFEALPNRVVAFLLLDANRDLEETEWELIAALHSRGIELRILLTKADRLRQSERNSAQRRLQDSLATAGLQIPLTWTFISAKTGEGVDLLRRLLYRYAQNEEA